MLVHVPSPAHPLLGINQKDIGYQSVLESQLPPAPDVETRKHTATSYLDPHSMNQTPHDQSPEQGWLEAVDCCESGCKGCSVKKGSQGFM